MFFGHFIGTYIESSPSKRFKYTCVLQVTNKLLTEFFFVCVCVLILSKCLGIDLEDPGLHKILRLK